MIFDRVRVSPQSLGVQRPGAILGQGDGCVAKPRGGRSSAPSETPAIRRAPPRHLLQSSGSGATPSPPWWATFYCKRQVWAPGAGDSGARSPRAPAAIFPPLPPHLFTPSRSVAEKIVLTQCVYVVFCTDWAENRLEGVLPVNPKPQFSENLPTPVLLSAASLGHQSRALRYAPRPPLRGRGPTDKIFPLCFKTKGQSQP